MRAFLLFLSLMLMIAARAQQEPSRPRPQDYKPHLPSENAYDYYLVACEKIQQEGASERWESTPNPYSQQPPSEIVLRYLRANEPALRLLAEGARKKYWVPVDDTDPGALFPHFARFRELGRLIGLQIRRDIATEDGTDAVRHFLDGMKFARDVEQGPLIAYLVGGAIEAILIRPIAEQVDYFSAKECRLLIEGLRKIEASPDPFWQAMQTEWKQAMRWLDEVEREGSKETAGFMTWFGEGEEEQAVEEAEAVQEAPDPEAEAERRYLAQLREKVKAEIAKPGGLKSLLERTRGQVNTYYQRVLFEASKPMWERSLPERPEHPEDPAAYLASLFTPDSGLKTRTYVRLSATRRLLATHLALRAHQLRYGYYPAKLEELKLGNLTIDPFNGKPFVYPLEADRYRLYSVGPDGKDDGGVPYRLSEEGKAPPVYDLFLLPNVSK